MLPQDEGGSRSYAEEIICYVRCSRPSPFAKKGKVSVVSPHPTQLESSAH
jgi:hypothetical protein